MITLLFQGQFALFFLIIIALVISLSAHEWGHAWAAQCFGDDTAARLGRLTLNPLAHIDAIGLLMVVMVGFGYAKPVPFNPSRMRSRWAILVVAAAGPLMNLLIAFTAVNLFSLLLKVDIPVLTSPAIRLFFSYLAIINLVLMLFNLIPLGPLDGHYILPYFLSKGASRAYNDFNDRYGSAALMMLILLSVIGVPIFQIIFSIGQRLVPWLQVF